MSSCVYISRAIIHVHMSSVLIWSIESVLLGLWALVLSSYSTPFHVFIAKSHVLISSFTLIVQIYVKARRLVVGSAVSQAFVCAVSSLFISYISMIVLHGTGSVSDNNNYSMSTRTKYFKLPLVGFITLDACVGLGWLTAAFISSLGMAFSFVEKENTTTTTKPVTVSLMFHPYGLHLLVIIPCLVIMFALDQSLLVSVIFWAVYIFMMYLNLVYNQHKYSIVLGMVTKLFLVIFIVCFYLINRLSLSFEHGIIVLTLLAISVLCTFEVGWFISTIIKTIWHSCFGVNLQIPTIDSFFGRAYEENQQATAAAATTNTTIATDEHTNPTPPPSNLGSMFNISQQYTSQRSYRSRDPAAVHLNYDREKIV
jgi:hypothetical protein